MMDPEKLAQDLTLAFPAFSVRTQRAEITLEPSVHVLSTHPFQKAELARLLDFANERGLAMSVGGSGTAFHTATYRKD